MAPSDHNSPERDAFDALPSGTPPPGLDTRISALARDAVTPRRSRRLTQFAGSLATLALAAFLVRPLWHAAPDTVPTSTPGSAEVSAPVASQISAAAEADELVLEEAVIFDRAERATAAVADTRNKSFDANQTLGASSGIDTASVLSEMAKSRAAKSPSQRVEVASETDDAPPVTAAQWWQQIQTLIEYGHTDKARREFRLLKEQHPDFTLPEGVPAATRALLGLPNQE